MMKKVIVLFISLFISQRASAQSLVDTPLIVTSLSMNLAGDVDSVTELTLAVKVLEVGATLQSKGDSGSKVITVPDTSFSILEERAWKFDDKGRMLSQVHNKPDKRKGDLEEVDAEILNYRNGKVQYVLKRKDGSLSDSAAYVYRGRDKDLSMQEMYDGKGKYTGRIQYFQNKEGRLSTISHKNAGLELVKMIKYWYDEKGTVTSATHHDKDQKLVLTQKFDVSTDSAGNLHTMIFDYAKIDTCTGMKSYLLNDAGNHLEDVTQDEKGNVLYISTAKFNDYNHVIHQTVFTDVKKVVTCTYEYDAQKNWTLKRVYHNGIPQFFVRRTIIYKSNS